MPYRAGVPPPSATPFIIIILVVVVVVIFIIATDQKVRSNTPSHLMKCGCYHIAGVKRWQLWACLS